MVYYNTLIYIWYYLTIELILLVTKITALAVVG